MREPWPTVRRRRKLTAKETAKRLGISTRTVQRHVAEARDTYETRATLRKTTAGTMRAAGSTWAEIAAAVDGTEWAARALVRRWNEEQEQEKPGKSPQPPKRLTP
jgi:transposase